jgi:hypothetical protein
MSNSRPQGNGARADGRKRRRQIDSDEILIGIYAPDSGTITFKGERLHITNTHYAYLMLNNIAGNLFNLRIGLGHLSDVLELKPELPP